MTSQSNSFGQLSAKIDTYVEELAALTDLARVSEAMQSYLDSLTRFHTYSWHNRLLIMLARSNASQVAGFKAWMRLKRHVKKGEKGIPVLAPVFFHADRNDPESMLEMRFKVVYVFDVSQTEGEPLPPVPDWKSAERHTELTDRLMGFAASLGIAVTVETLDGETLGLSKGGAIALSPEAGTPTFVHELAHELLHRSQADRPAIRSERELEAEAVAYVVSRHFGLDGLNSPNYLALWHADATLIRARMQRISNCSQQIITAVEGKVPDAAESLQ